MDVLYLLSGTVFAGIGASGLNGVGKTAAHAVAGGTMSVAQGGKFGEGFLSAGVAKFATLRLTENGMFDMSKGGFGNVAGRTMVAAAVGGTASAIGGGKFANGARTAAFAHLLNHELSAAKEVLTIVSKFSKGRFEIGGSIKSVKGGYSYTRPTLSPGMSFSPDDRYTSYHTHPSGFKFSNTFFPENNGGNNDINWMKVNRKGGYLGTYTKGKVNIGYCDRTCSSAGYRGTAPIREIK